ncbi:plakophilin-3 isoform X5 [Lates calcarifer]|uniref:Plakophilin-3 isoform X5 n=1 Tax=Lates calcarifer TaxID=8187 RepID=A0AAJ8B3Q0_LATCA|nr:plakophilin-3 isoform X5 [Lates calcarifer]
MSVAVAEGCFLSALHPNSSCTAYVVPSDGPSSDPVAKARRVREQVRMRLAEKSSSLPRLNDSLVGSTDYSLPEAKGFILTHGFSSRSTIHTPSRIMAVPTVPLHYSRSAMEGSSKVSHKGTSMVESNFQTFQSHSRSRRSKSLCQADQEGFPVTVLVPSENTSYPNTVPPSGTLRRSLSGILAQERGYWQEEELPYQYTYKGPSHRTISRITNRQQHYQQQSSALDKEGWLGTGRGVPMAGDSWGTQWQQHVSKANHAMGTGQYQASLNRASSLRSLKSVGKGVDVLDGASIHSNDPLGEMQGLDMATAVRYLSKSDTALQILGAAYIQHQCYHSKDAKNQVLQTQPQSKEFQPLSSYWAAGPFQVWFLHMARFCLSSSCSAFSKLHVRVLHGIPALVQLFTSDNQEVQHYATGATRNLIYENVDNKVALIEAGGVMHLVSILGEHDEELQKTITGVLWNLSSRDNLKEKLSKEALAELTEKVLIPLCSRIPLCPSERDIFYNTTGCLRNLSSVNERTRQKMRDMQGLVDSLVSYIQQEERADDKGLENSLCVMRNLSYQLYMELPPSVRLRLDGPTRDYASRDSATIGCFTTYSKKTPEWSSFLSGVMMERERMLPILLDLLDTNSDMELRPLTGLLRNLARHSTNKDHIAKNMVNVLVSKLPCDGLQKMPCSEVVINICGALNHLVTCSSVAASDISYFNGLPKLVGIKTFHDNSPGSLKAARAASTVLYNMFQYNKLHKDYKLFCLHHTERRCALEQKQNHKH